MGYGTHNLGTGFHNKLQSTEVTSIPNEECKYLGGGRPLNYIEDDMMCAHGDGERDACSGDSGGPLFSETKRPLNGTNSSDDTSSVYQVGIVSWVSSHTSAVLPLRSAPFMRCSH